MMMGRGSRNDEGSFTVTNSNVFAALESLRKKKKSDKEKGASKGSKAASKSSGAGKLKETEEETQVYWAPAPLTAKSWADVDDEDDDDYFATTAPPPAIWGGSGPDKAEDLSKPDVIEESESEYEILDEGDDDVEEDHDRETDIQEQVLPSVKEPAGFPPAPKEAERQLSKKERRKKELEELEAILADFGVNQKDKAEDEQSDALKESNESQLNGDAAKKDNAVAVAESKPGKRKKKKEKASKEETDGVEPAEKGESSVDIKERLKKATAAGAPAKKKKSNKEMDGAARAVAMEAAARNAKLAAVKKKEKSHYNQQPTR